MKKLAFIVLACLMVAGSMAQAKRYYGECFPEHLRIGCYPIWIHQGGNSHKGCQCPYNNRTELDEISTSIDEQGFDDQGFVEAGFIDPVFSPEEELHRVCPRVFLPRGEYCRKYPGCWHHTGRC